MQATENNMKSQNEKINAIEESVQMNLASIERSERKHADAIQQCRALLDDLPAEVSGDASPETGIDLKALSVRSKAMDAQQQQQHRGGFNFGVISAVIGSKIWRTQRHQRFKT